MTSLEQRELVTNASEVRWTEVSVLPPASIRRPSSQRELVALSLLLRPGTEEYARR